MLVRSDDDCTGLPLRSHVNLARGESAMTTSAICLSHHIDSLSPAAAATLFARAASSRRTAAVVRADSCPHSCWLHLPAIESGPAHGLPGMLGLGLSHRRRRTPVPPPQVFVHRSHSPHSLQPPSLGGPSTSGGRRHRSLQFTVHTVLPPRLATEKYRIKSGGRSTAQRNCSTPAALWP